MLYAVESVDHSGSLQGITLPDGLELRSEAAPELLGGVVVLRGGRLTAIPYALWANRGRSEMAVWLRR